MYADAMKLFSALFLWTVSPGGGPSPSTSGEGEA